MTIFKKTMSMLLALALLVSLAPHVALEAAAVKPGELHQPIRQTGWQSNPLYPQRPAPDDFPLQASIKPASEGETVSFDAAAEQLRQQLVNRVETIDFNFYIDPSDPRYCGDETLFVLLDEAMRHTGEPTEGDYLLLQYAGFNVSYGTQTSEKGKRFYGTYYLSYYTTLEQEQELDRAVADTLASLKLEGLSEYEKVSRIYAYIAENVRYDWGNVNNWDYVLQYTAYAALINGTAVCQGYSNLLYRLLLEAGVDCRSIVSIPEECHAWNIVRVGGWYYNCDVTWDEGSSPDDYLFFLKGDEFYADHTPEVDYRTEEFLQKHPMSSVDYDPANPPTPPEPGPTEHVHRYVAVVTEPTCTDQGFTTYICECGEQYVDDYTEALGHHWDESIVTTDPTCTEQGFTTYTCSCGYSVITDYTEALGHDWDEGVVTKEPTEDREGVLTTTCLRCGETETASIPRLEHVHRYDPFITEPTCMERGYTTCICSCGESYTTAYTDALGHDWDEGVITTQPTEDAEGIMTFTCRRCGVINTKQVPQLEHTHSYEPEIVEPTCTERGYTIYTCSCGETYKDEYTDMLPHDWGENVVVTEPTEDAEGVMTTTCKRCGKREISSIPKLEHTHSYEPIITPPTCREQGFTTYLCSCGEQYTSDFTPMLEHQWDDIEILLEPTEDAEGVMKQVCLRCDDVQEVPIPKIPHTHKFTSVVTEPNCTEKGFTTYTCSCGFVKVDDFTDALGHDWDEGVVTKEPTEDTEGVLTSTCLRCGKTETSSIPTLEHVHRYESVITEPSCTEQGYTTCICACGESYTTAYTEALGHDWDEGVITTQPTEDAEGIITFTCQLCGVTDTDPVPKLEHTHSYEPEIVAPTCTEQGYTIYTCSCGEAHKDDYTEILPHDWGENVVVTEPTEDAEGVMTTTCNRCGKREISSIPKLDHTHKYEDVVTTPTCTEPGFTTHTCACGDSYVDAHTDPVGHYVFYWDVVTQGSCTEPEVKTGVCLQCQTEVTETTEPTGHVFTDTVFDPTCTEGGYTYHSCKYCSTEDSIIDRTEPLGHDWGEWVIVSLRTCTTEGYRYRDCGRCGEREEERSPAWDHQYTPVVTEPTCTEGGFTTYTCLCGTTYIDDFTDALDHEWDNGRMTKEPVGNEPGEITYTCVRCGETQVKDVIANPCPFTDVAGDAYYYEPVLWAVERSITSGISATLFAPNQNCTRGQVVTFLWRSAGSPLPGSEENPFTDVKDGTYYYHAVLWAVEMGITQGVSADRFAPDNQVTRAQFVTFLWRAAGNPAVQNAENPFSDITMDTYFTDAVLWAAENGVTTGTSSTTFAPNVGCTRGQVVTFLYRSKDIPLAPRPEEPGEPDTPDNNPDTQKHEAYGAVVHEQWKPAVPGSPSELPRFDDRATREGIQQILDTYDPDGALMFRWEVEDAFEWISILDGMTSSTDTAIHETYHGFSFDYGWENVAYYLEDGYYLVVPETNVYPSSEMTEWIPEENRTFRFDPYVIPGTNQASNLLGIYGLLDEFNAYQIGMNYGASLFDYYAAQEQSFDPWMEYINICENNRMAYAEFRYYMLTYLLYAKENYPEEFQGFLDNEKLRYAFTVVEANFAEDIAKYEQDLLRIEDGEVPNTPAVTVSDDFIWYGSQGMGRFTADYKKLMAAMEAPEYVEMMQAFILK